MIVWLASFPKSGNTWLRSLLSDYINFKNNYSFHDTIYSIEQFPSDYHFDFLLDLHTASFGRVNSFYIRADLKSKTAYELANLQNPEIILNAPPKDGTLRGAAAELGIEAITIEVGDPDKFQTGMIKSGLQGVYNTMVYLGMYSKETTLDNSIPVTCEKSLWLYTDMGGILQVLPSLTQRIKKGELIATLRDVFGRVIKEYNSPNDGIVIVAPVVPLFAS